VHDHRNDVAVFVGWALQLRAQAPWEFHGLGGYPPGYFPVLLVIGHLEAFITRHGGDPGGLILRELVKLPSMIMDVVNAWIIYGIARCIAPRAALAAAICWLFNPVGLIDSTFWGQIDAVCWGFALGAILCALLAARDATATARWFAAAWVLLGMSLLVKPVALTWVPVLAVYAACGFAGTLRQRMIGSVAGLAGASAIGWALCSLFSGIANPLGAAAWLFNELTVRSMMGVAGAYTSVNAYNIWSVVMPFYLPDTGIIAGLSVHTWSALVASAFILVILARFAKLRDGRALVECALLVVFAFFLFNTRMHERYVDGAVMLAVALIGLGPRYLAYAIVFTITTSLDTLYGLRFGDFFSVQPPYAAQPGVNLRDFWPAVSHPASLINVVLFGMMLASFVRPRATEASSPRERRRAPQTVIDAS